MRSTILTALLLLALVSPAAADYEVFGQATTAAEQDLQASLEELARLRERIAAEKLPMTRELNELQNRLIKLRAEFDDLTREIDSSSLDINNLQTQIQGRKDEKEYLSNNLDEYIRNLETRIHVSELQRYRELLEEARLAPEDNDLSLPEVFARQVAAVDASADRLLDLVGGARFSGKAVADDGILQDVTFALIGPVALYRSEDGKLAGLAEQKLNSAEPNMVSVDDPDLTAGVASLVASGKGTMPFDPTGGDAQKVAATEETLWEHIQKGGVVMWPILLLAASALLVALLKLVQLLRVAKPPESRTRALLEAVRQGNRAEAARRLQGIKGPTGEMLKAGVENLSEPKALVEEMMFERMLETRLELQRFLSFVAVAAAAAPLLGLLGTVTGIINTFKLITVFGTGDAKTLSSGISEALITTKFGLIVAIPALLLHAYLSRKSRRFVDHMEKTAVQFLNRIPGKLQGASQAARSADGNGRAEQPDSKKARAVAGMGSPHPAIASPESADH